MTDNGNIFLLFLITVVEPTNLKSRVLFSSRYPVRPQTKTYHSRKVARHANSKQCLIAWGAIIPIFQRVFHRELFYGTLVDCKF